ncbi:phosphonate ABC transporter, permease protein PhnE [Actinomadura sp. 3N508]|uniref:phosphonate ABC transporter, permease protein PhnE n=1 Tax=Actinomadura sp. 3N508 TaxID=3375153 RepID=UPI0037B4CC1A
MNTPVTAPPAPDEQRAAPPRRSPILSPIRWLVVAAVVAACLWSLIGTGVGIGSLIDGRQGAAQLLGGLFPPELDGELLRRVGTATAETLQISIAALVLGAAAGLPLAVLIAGNVAAPRPVAAAARVVAAALRGVPELLWALLFVAAVGLGPAAGVYAVGLHAAGVVAKLCSEQMEAVEAAPVEAMRLTGASRTATTFLAIIPQARANIASQLLYQWECNLRSSVVIGFVGAGGIGQDLGIALRLFRYQELATLMLAVLILVLGVDRLSKIFRSRLGAASGNTPGHSTFRFLRLRRSTT